MFGITIMPLGAHVVVVKSNGHPLAINPSHGTQLCGAVGLALARRQYRNMLANWYQNANSWWCGEQDHYGEMLDHQAEEVDRLGGNSRVDRRVVAGQYA